MSGPERIGPGAVIDDRYEILSHLGTGGFGLVYRARQLNTGQLVAVKIARQFEGPGASAGLARFKREMDVVAELSHPNIVRLIDAGQITDGRLFAVLELVRGNTLAEILSREGPLDPSEAKHLMIQVLDALFSAHDLGVIHRDLKPANIMVNSVGARRNAMVLDFGIATFVKTVRAADYQSLTPDGSVGGTPAYMAPEQFHGREPNPQTDIYAWALVFLECLTGQCVVRGTTMAETMYMHLRDDPHPMPSPLANHPLGRILGTALAKDPAQRYTDTRDALIDLVACDVSDLTRAALAAPGLVVEPSRSADPMPRKLDPDSKPERDPEQDAERGPEQDAERDAPAPPAIRWLHISDLHAGGPGTALHHDLLDALAPELRDMAEQIGPPDLILLTGDAAHGGHPDDYFQADGLLERIHGWLREVHGDAPPPLLFAVPGNHDVMWPGRKERRAYRVLGDYEDTGDPDVRDLRDELWRDHDVGLIEPLFEHYARWQRSRVVEPLASDERCVNVHTSFFPGDLSAVIEKDGFRLGLIGLNSAWTQYAPGDFAGKLHITREQLLAAWSQDRSAYERALLLLHHPPSWLSPQARGVLEREAEAFDALLYGHGHAARMEVVAHSESDPQAAFQAPSLFGLASAGTEQRARVLGYAWGEIRQDGALRVWPRLLAPGAEGGWGFASDQRFEAEAENGAVWLRPPPSARRRRARRRSVVPSRVEVLSSSFHLAGSAASFDSALAEYARWTRSTFERIDMAGVGGGHLRLRLEDVFVPLRFRNRAAEADDAMGATQRRNENIVVELAEVFTRAQPARHLFILGEPGAGKTTALKKLLWWTLAADGRDRFDGTRIGLPADTVPLFLRLRDLTPAQRRKSMGAFLDAQLAQLGALIDPAQEELADEVPAVALPPGFGRMLWQRGHILLLFDGLDEIADSAQRAEVCRYIESHLATARTQGIQGIRVVVSSRYAGLYGASHSELPEIGFGPEFSRLDICPLNDSQVEILITRWFVAAECSMARISAADEEDAAARGQERGSELATQLRAPEYASRRIKELVSNPLLLTLLCVQVFDGGHIPRRRVDFFHDCLRTLLRRWTRGAGEAREAPLLELGDALRLLRPVAWALHTAERKSDMSRAELRQAMRDELRRLQIDRQVSFEEVLDWLWRRTGVLTEFAPGEFGFLHLSLQEYLAATYAGMHLDEGLARLAEGFGEPWWREVVLLFVALNEGQFFAPLVSRVLARGEVLEREESLLRACLDEAGAADTTPLIELIAAKNAPTAQRVAALRLVLHRVDDRVRRAAMRAAVQAPRGSELRALAEEVEDRRLPADVDPELAGPEELVDVVLVSVEDEPMLAPLREALAGANLRALPMLEDAASADPGEAEDAAGRARAAAALVGPDGVGPWETLHLRALLHAFIDRGLPVLPVLLPGAGRPPELPRFLSQYTWVDLRAGIDEAGVGQLVWGVTGVEPMLSTDVRALAAMPREQFFVEPTTGIRFLWIPGGTFRMGANDLSASARPPHKVEVAPFWLAETLVTNRQYEQFLVATGYDEPMYWRERRYSEPEQPVVGVRWQDALAFCAWLGEVSGYPISLPTEAQWEFAARGEDNLLYPWGNEEPDGTRAHFASPGSTPRPVGSLPAGRGPFGTLDQAGNVWEWCRDEWDPTIYGRRLGLTIDPCVGAADDPDAIHVVRGGSFLSHPLYLRAAYRDRYRAILADDLGFRVVAAPGNRPVLRTRSKITKTGRP